MHNRGAYPATCELHPVPTPHILNYNLASFATWKQHIVSGSGGYITSCSDEFAHGMYDMGKHPAVALVYDTGLKAITVHEGLSQAEISADKSGCGVPKNQPYVVLDTVQWPLLR